MRKECIEIECAINFILGNEEAVIAPKRGRKKVEPPPVWSVNFYDPKKNRTFALISMCIKENYNQSLSELAFRLSVNKSRPVAECLRVLKKLEASGKLGYYDENRMFRKWESKEDYIWIGKPALQTTFADTAI